MLDIIAFILLALMCTVAVLFIINVWYEIQKEWLMKEIGMTEYDAMEFLARPNRSELWL